MKYLRRIDEYLGITESVKMEDRIHPNVPNGDRKMIEWAGWAICILILPLYAFLELVLYEIGKATVGG